MTVQFYVLLVLVTLAAFSAGTIVASRGVALAWRPLAARIERLAPSRRARWLVALRLAPTLCAVLSSLVLGLAFFGYEPRNTHEPAGGVLAVLSAMALTLGVFAFSRVAGLLASDSVLWRLLRQCRQWTCRDGGAVAIVETPYPVAAVAGVFHPRLLLSARMLRECTPEEIDTIVAHERAHVRRRDNLVRALLAVLPDHWLAPRVNHEIERCWTRAVEEAADAEAAGGGDGPRAALAATLIRVARMADAAPPAWMPQLAFYQGTDLEHRVRTLLAEPCRDSGIAACIEAAAVTAAVTLAAWGFASASSLHALMEVGLSRLP